MTNNLRHVTHSGKEKTVLITGATSGIGLALFQQYAQQGDNIIACGRNQEKLAELESEAFKTSQFV